MRCRCPSRPRLPPSGTSHPCSPRGSGPSPPASHSASTGFPGGRAGSRESSATEARLSVVILVAQVRDEVLAHHPAERILELHALNEEIVLRVEPFRGHRALEVKAEPLLHSTEARSLREIHEQREVEDQRG